MYFLFQGIDYNWETNELIWAETEGDHEKKSSCRLVIHSSSGTRTLIKLEMCYPFSLTSDSNFIYWSDWAREGIMKIDKNSLELTKIAHTPSIQSKHGGHNGAFGIINLSRKQNCFDSVSVNDEIFHAKPSTLSCR